MPLLGRIPMSQYHASSALSNSKLSVFAEFGPEHFHRQFIARNLEDKDSRALLLGAAFDTLVFDGEAEFAKQYAIKPEGMNFSTKEGKEWRAAQELNLLDVVTHDEFEMFAEMHAAVLDHEIAAALLEKGEAQVSVRRELPDLGVEIQARPDWLSILPCDGLTEKAYIVDLKTTADLASFDRNCIGYGYHRQISLAQWLLAREGIVCEAFLLVVEKKVAPRVRVKRIPEEVLSLGWGSVKADVERIAKHVTSGEWRDRQSAIEDIIVPQWQMGKLL